MTHSNGLLSSTGKVRIIGQVTEYGNVVPDMKDPSYTKYSKFLHEQRFKKEKRCVRPCPLSPVIRPFSMRECVASCRYNCPSDRQTKEIDAELAPKQTNEFKGMKAVVNVEREIEVGLSPRVNSFPVSPLPPG